MTKRYLKTPEEVIDALQAGKVVIDGVGYNYKMYKGVILWKEKERWDIAPTLDYRSGLHINESEPLRLEVGKFYKTRDGRKAWVFQCVAMKDAFPFRVAVQNELVIYTVTKEGRRFSVGMSGEDLVAPWEEQ